MNYKITRQWLDEKCDQIKNEDLRVLFRNCFLSTLDRAVTIKPDGSTYVITGDIPAMWLRDSAAQVATYVRVADIDPEINAMLKGVLKRQFMYLNIDPYANAFNEEPNGNGHKDITKQNNWVWERKFELDSLCYPFWLASKLYHQTGENDIFDSSFVTAARLALQVMEIEQDHAKLSDYSFIREGQYSQDTLENNGTGKEVAVTGMIWSAFRPSDDKNMYGYLIPSNQFAVTVLEFLIEVFATIVPMQDIADKALKICTKVKQGLEKYSTIQTKDSTTIYAYETDGLGNYNVMDDANVPSLLSVPYLGYKGDSTVYLNTRAHLLSDNNTFYYQGKLAKGIGSPHTPVNHIWHMGLIVQGLTSDSDEEKRELLQMLVNTHAGAYHMHESFHKDDPSIFTREWFGWADSLFAEFVLANLDTFLES